MPTGIYMLMSKREPWKFYIGSANSIKLRYMIHLGGIIHKNHPNKKLLNHFLKYGINDMELLIVKLCSREDLLKEEQKAIDTFQPYFNICLTAGSRLNVSHLPGTRLKIKNKLKTSRQPNRYESLRGRFVKQRS